MIYAATSYSAKPMFMYVVPTAELETALDYQVTDTTSSYWMWPPLFHPSRAQPTDQIFSKDTFLSIES